MLAGGETVLIGVSGGADSVALLLALLALAPRWRLTLHVLHVDHRLRPDSADDAAFVTALGARLDVPVDVAAVSVGPGSPEEAARVARYAALTAAAERVGATRIALGHTADDQAETVLMRVLAGAGVRGLAGIPAVRGRIIRPLLETRRADVRAALEADGIAWREDPTNRDPAFLRNRMRHEILPRLADASGGDVVGALTRVARLARETVDALDRVAGDELARLAHPEAGALTLSRSALATLPAAVAAEVLRQAAVRQGGRPALRAWGHRGLARVLAAPPPRRPFRLAGVTVEVSGDRVRVGGGPAPRLVARAVPVPGRVELTEVGVALEARRTAAAGVELRRDADSAVFDADALVAPLRVRGRSAGDRFRAFGGGERRLKSVLIDAKVPRWRRDAVPLVEAGGEIVWVAGLRRGAAAPVTARTREVIELRLVPLAQPAPAPLQCGP